MIAEVYGRATGICRGMGGSMHVADFSRGIIGANGIVGGGIALTVGPRSRPSSTARATWPSPSSATGRPTRAC